MAARVVSRVVGARVVSAIAHADPGGVVFHCSVGRDRTGLVSALVLSLVGVAADLIADDYDLNAIVYGGQGAYDRLEELDAAGTPVFVNLNWPEAEKDRDPEEG